MSTGEFFVFESNKEQAVREPFAVTTISLGENNIGTIGPDDIPEEIRQAITEANAAPEFAKQPTNRWICVDGRLSLEEKFQDAEASEADPQIAGGVVVSETAAFYMAGTQTKKMSTLLGEKTTEAVDDDIRVTVHGDDHAGKEGCGANKKLCDRAALRFNAANSDIVAPRAWAIVDKLGISGHLTQEDVTQSILDGKANADNDELWDVTASQAADIILANGGEYIELIGAHKEKNIRADFDENTAFAKAKFVSALSTSEEIEQFAASFGVYKKTTFERAQKHGRSERDAALQVLRVVLFNVSICKNLGSQKIAVDLVG
jgi:hypothetical protein